MATQRACLAAEVQFVRMARVGVCDTCAPQLQGQFPNGLQRCRCALAFLSPPPFERRICWACRVEGFRQWQRWRPALLSRCPRCGVSPNPGRFLTRASICAICRGMTVERSQGGAGGGGGGE